MDTQDAASEVFGAESLDDLLHAVTLRARELCGTEKASIILVDAHRGDLYFRVAAEEGELLSTIRVPLSDASIAGACVLAREPVVVQDVAQDQRHFPGVDRATANVTRSILAVPMVANGEALGVLEAINKRGDEAFVPQDVTALSTLADMAANSLSHLNEIQGLRSFYTFALEVFADLSDACARRPGRSMRVAQLSRAVGRHLRLSEEALRRLWIASYCHDFGRLDMLSRGVQHDAVQAAQVGAAVLAGNEALAPAADLVRMLHERIDGSGLPAHLRAGDIPLEAQVLAMAVDFENVRDSADGLLPQAPGVVEEAGLTAYFVNRSEGRHAAELLEALSHANQEH